MTLIRNDILNFITTQINNGIDDFKNKFLFIQIQTDEIVNVTDTITRTVISNINSNKKIKGILYHYKTEIKTTQYTDDTTLIIKQES